MQAGYDGGYGGHMGWGHFGNSLHSVASAPAHAYNCHGGGSLEGGHERAAYISSAGVLQVTHLRGTPHTHCSDDICMPAAGIPRRSISNEPSICWGSKKP